MTDMTTTPEALKLAREALQAVAASTLRPSIPKDAAVMNEVRAALAALAALPAPSGEPSDGAIYAAVSEATSPDWHAGFRAGMSAGVACAQAAPAAQAASPAPAEDTLQQIAAAIGLPADDPALLVSAIKTAMRVAHATVASPAPAVPADPTDPGFDVPVLREHVRHLERRVRQLAATPKEAPAPLTDAEIDVLWRAPMSADWEHREFARAIERAHGITAPTAPHPAQEGKQ